MLFWEDMIALISMLEVLLFLMSIWTFILNHLDLNIHATIKKITLRNMLGSIPHQKFLFYHLPTRGWVGIKLGDAWYVSNVSIIFDCSMLLYYPFWMFMGFTIHFYIIFGTNLLIGGLARIAVFLPISVFRRKEISNGIQTEWNLRERDFWNERDPEDLESKSRSSRGSHEIGGCAPPIGHAPCLMGPSGGHRRTSSSYISLHTPKTSRSTTKHYFHRRNLLYPWDPILEPSPTLRRRGNQPQRASTSTSLPLRWVVSSLPQTYGSIVIS